MEEPVDRLVVLPPPAPFEPLRVYTARWDDFDDVVIEVWSQDELLSPVLIEAIEIEEDMFGC